MAQMIKYKGKLFREVEAKASTRKSFADSARAKRPSLSRRRFVDADFDLNGRDEIADYMNSEIYPALDGYFRSFKKYVEDELKKLESKDGIFWEDIDKAFGKALADYPNISPATANITPQ